MFRVDPPGQIGEKTVGQQVPRRNTHVGRVRHVLIADLKRLFGRFNAMMDIVGAINTMTAQVQAIEDPKDHQRHDALGRRGEIVDRPQAVL